MMSIYVTGDTHIPLDLDKLSEENFQEQSKLTKDDYVIICGDFGGVWNNSSEELYWREWLNSRNFTTLFIDGNHENFELLNNYDVKYWKGGTVHFVNDSILHLMRGQVYEIDGLKIFTMGGAASIDKRFRVEGISWWKEEEPSDEEFDEALNNLDIYNREVDIVITHTTSIEVMEILGYIKETIPINNFFSFLDKDLKYRHWYFGHFHNDMEIDAKHTLVFDKVIKIHQ